jgi:hypothetical protein
MRLIRQMCAKSYTTYADDLMQLQCIALQSLTKHRRGTSCLVPGILSLKFKYLEFCVARVCVADTWQCWVASAAESACPGVLLHCC